ncbi:hypothetical protein K458DRAFT_421810 [Lentithecium fluviatile CBS 122367]|uniref:Uncharacterized protein n=1 Tax=Lentithecium fluviatile CBS 122367 TaxID=1168545 RepID=A0A6G1INZ8_9PLEO|nr:hypothetical protein K458DRAFT_421810 [Lentithecium fluviatile CBS 122367]
MLRPFRKRHNAAHIKITPARTPSCMIREESPLERKRALCARRPPLSLHHCCNSSNVFIEARESNGITNK